jgi:sugar/nucleoside kinase (ribokinase family)
VVCHDPAGPRAFTMKSGARRHALETLMDLSDVVLMTEVNRHGQQPSGARPTPQRTGSNTNVCRIQHCLWAVQATNKQQLCPAGCFECARILHLMAACLRWSQEEALEVTGLSDPQAAAEVVLARPGAKTQWCVVKRGASGALLATKAGEVYSAGAFKVGAPWQHLMECARL